MRRLFSLQVLLFLLVSENVIVVAKRTQRQNIDVDYWPEGEPSWNDRILESQIIVKDGTFDIDDTFHEPAISSEISARHLFITQDNPRAIAGPPNPLVYCAELEELAPNAPRDDKTLHKWLSRYHIIHLRSDDGKEWQPTTATRPQDPPSGVWWGVLVRMGEEPWINDLKMYRFRMDWKMEEERKCTQMELSPWYHEHELKRCIELYEQTWI